MLITRSSLRVSLVGGGTDLPSYIEQLGYGEVISFPINKYIYITSNKYFDPKKLSFKYSKIEVVNKFNDFYNPIIRHALRLFYPKITAREFASFSEIPSGTGLGSSSSFAGNLILHLKTLQNIKISSFDVAKLASDLEINEIGDNIGRQDHFGALIGGLKKIRFTNKGTKITKLNVNHELINYLNENMFLVRVGEQRSANEILTKVKSKEKKSIAQNGKELLDLVGSLESSLAQSDLDKFSQIMNEGWEIKKRMSDDISNDRINEIYNFGLCNGALCGKLCGAGGSGFIFFVCHNKKRLLDAFAKNQVEQIQIETKDLSYKKI